MFHYSEFSRRKIGIESKTNDFFYASISLLTFPHSLFFSFIRTDAFLVGTVKNPKKKRQTKFKLLHRFNGFISTNYFRPFSLTVPTVRTEYLAVAHKFQWQNDFILSIFKNNWVFEEQKMKIIVIEGICRRLHSFSVYHWLTSKSNAIGIYQIFFSSLRTKIKSIPIGTIKSTAFIRLAGDIEQSSIFGVQSAPIINLR